MFKGRNFLATAFTLTGSVIGAGILGLPYVFSRAGFPIGLFWLLVLGAVVLYVSLALGEVTLRTKERHQLPGYARKYLGKVGEKIMFFALFFGIYSALLAYLIGEGESFSQVFTGGLNFSLLFGIGFWLLMSVLLFGGIKRLKKIEFWGVLVIILTILVIFFILVPGVNLSNISYLDLSNFDSIFLPFGVVLFALLGFSSIPELRQEINKKKKDLKKAIIVGALIPVAIYLLFTFVFVGVLGSNVEQVATLSFGGVLGSLLPTLGIFTMFTSYFVLTFALKDYFIYDLKKKKLIIPFVVVIPLLLYLGISLFNLASFVKVLGIGGVISGGISAVLFLLMAIKAKKQGDRKPEYKVPVNWWIIGFLGLVFVLGILFELF